MLSLIFSTSQCPLNMTSEMAWTTKGIDCFNPTSINVVIPSSSTHTLLIDVVQIFVNTFHLSSKYSQKKSSLFHEVFLTRLTCQHHLVEFYLAMTNMASEIFHKITSTLGVMYNVKIWSHRQHNYLIFRLKTWCNWFNLDRLLLYHVVEMLKIHLGRIFSGKAANSLLCW